MLANATECIDIRVFARKCRWCKKSKSAWCKQHPARDLVECSRLCAEAGPSCSHAVFREPSCFLKRGDDVPLAPQPCSGREDQPRLVAVREGVKWHLTAPEPQCASDDVEAAALALPPSASAPPPLGAVGGGGGGGGQCTALLDRHVHKNGGSTMRELFLANEARGACVYWGYAAYAYQWSVVRSALVDYLREQGSGGGAPETALRLCAEFHYPAGGFNVSELAALREELSPPPAPAPVGAGGDGGLAASAAVAARCRVVLVTRLRSPLSYYLSFHRWSIASKQAAQPRKFGRTLADWLPPNLQTAVLYKPWFSDHAEHMLPGSSERNVRFREVDRAAYERVRDSLLRYDVVGTVERFDETLLLIADLAGLPHLLYTRPSQPVKSAKGRYVAEGSEDREATTARACPDMAECEATVKRQAPFDHRLYDEFSLRFDARISSLGAAFAARRAQLTVELEKARMVHEAEKVLGGANGRPPSSRCDKAKLVLRRLGKRERNEMRCAAPNLRPPRLTLVPPPHPTAHCLRRGAWAATACEPPPRAGASAALSHTRAPMCALGSSLPASCRGGRCPGSSSPTRRPSARTSAPSMASSRRTARVRRTRKGRRQRAGRTEEARG